MATSITTPAPAPAAPVSAPAPPMGGGGEGLAGLFTQAFAEQVAPPLEAPQAPPAVESPAAPVEAPTPPAPEPVVPEAEPSPDDLEDFSFDEAAQPPAEGEPETSTDPAKPVAEPEKIEGFSPEEEAKLLQSSRGRRMLAAFKRDRELAKPLEEGGIGRSLTIDEVRAGEQARLDMMALTHEFEANPTSWVNNFFTPDPATGQLRAGAEQVARVLPQLAAQRSPQVYSVLASETLRPIVETLSTAQPSVQLDPNTLVGATVKAVVDGMYRFAESFAPDSNDWKGAIYAAQVAEARWFGRPRDLSQQTQPAGQPGTDPEKEMLRRQLAQVESERQQATAQRVAQFTPAIQDAMSKTVLTDITTLFSQRVPGLAKSSKDFQWLTQDLLRDVIASVESNRANPAYQRTEILLSQARDAWARGNRGVAQSAVDAYRRLAQTEIRRLAPTYLKDAVTRARALNTATHAQISSTQGRVEAGNGAAPATTAQPQNGTPGWNPNRDYVENATDLFKSALGGR